MERDDTVFVMGEDVAVYGGAFKITKGMLERFGELRVVDTPLAESGIVGAGTGAAINGLRPVLEMQFADFMACGFDQITNFAAKCRYRWGQAIPMVIRAPAGGNIHGGPFHSQNVEMPYVHTPGLKVVQPSTAYDAKGLIKAAIRDDDPVIFLEHKYLYRSVKEELPTQEYTVPIGEAGVRREGSDISIITYGWMVHVALEAAENAGRGGKSAWRCWTCARSSRSIARRSWTRPRRPARSSCCTRTPSRVAWEASWPESSPSMRSTT